MAQKNVVIRSYNLDGETLCVDIFRRPDGTYGFEEYRREPEDGRGWFAIGNYSSHSFDRESEAVANAKASISWLAWSLKRRGGERGCGWREVGMLPREKERKAKTTRKPGIGIVIPGFGTLHVKAICSDYTGTLSCQGRIIRGVKNRLRKLSRVVDIHVVTSDTRRTASRELKPLTTRAGVTLTDKIPGDVCHDEFKEKYIRALGLDLRHVVVFGNGRNDAKWLKAVRDAQGLAVAVDVGEGCAAEAMNNATIFVGRITDALDLLLDTKRIIGTLRTE